LSEEFLRVAKAEMTDDIAGMGNLLSQCRNDTDIMKYASDVEKHVHKIKGLAPMMGQEQIGNIAALLDKILKSVLSGKAIPGVYSTLIQSHKFMKDTINNSPANYDQLCSQITQAHRDLL
jgi:HPt (histidine-containing phosphotransfer) domain-containing protein